LDLILELESQVEINGGQPDPRRIPWPTSRHRRITLAASIVVEANHRALGVHHPWLSAVLLAQSSLSPLTRHAEQGDRQPERFSAPPHLRVSRWRRWRALPIAGGGRDVGGPGIRLSNVEMRLLASRLCSTAAARRWWEVGRQQRETVQ
jgi:hypothetical protein